MMSVERSDGGDMHTSTDRTKATALRSMVDVLRGLLRQDDQRMMTAEEEEVERLLQRELALRVRGHGQHLF